MSERAVAIPVDKKLRDMIKEAKGRQTYTEFITKLVSK